MSELPSADESRDWERICVERLNEHVGDGDPTVEIDCVSLLRYIRAARIAALRTASPPPGPPSPPRNPNRPKDFA